MAFVIKQSSQGFFYPVKIQVVGDTGTTHQHTFEVKFKRFSRTALAELLKRHELAKDDNLSPEEILEKDVQNILEIAEDWRHVVDGSGKPVDFNTENIRSMLDEHHRSAFEILGAFFEATNGGAARKN